MYRELLTIRADLEGITAKDLVGPTLVAIGSSPSELLFSIWV